VVCLSAISATITVGSYELGRKKSEKERKKERMKERKKERKKVELMKKKSCF